MTDRMKKISQRDIAKTLKILEVVQSKVILCADCGRRQQP